MEVQQTRTILQILALAPRLEALPQGVAGALALEVGLRGLQGGRGVGVLEDALVLEESGVRAGLQVFLEGVAAGGRGGGGDGWFFRWVGHG